MLSFFCCQSVSLLQLYLAIVEAFDDCKRFNVYSFLAEHVAAGLEPFLNQERHSHNLRSSLRCKVKYTDGGISVGKEIIYKKATLALLQVAVAKADVV